MTSVTIQLTSNTAFSVVRVDDNPIHFNSSGQCTLELSETIHVLTWIVKGIQGDQYTLQVTSPASAAWITSATLDHFGLDFGFHEITL